MRDIIPPKTKQHKKGSSGLFVAIKYLFSLVALSAIVYFGFNYAANYIDKTLELEPIDVDISENNDSLENSTINPANSESKIKKSLNDADNELKDDRTAVSDEIDKSNIKIRVINGNAIYFSASEAQKKLEADGFRVSSIGNAENQNYLSTVIYFKSGKSNEAELIKSTMLDGNYQASTEENSTLVGENDILVVVGKK